MTHDDMLPYLDKSVTMVTVTGNIFLGTIIYIGVTSIVLRSGTGEFTHRLALDKIVSVAIPIEKEVA